MTLVSISPQARIGLPPSWGWKIRTKGYAKKLDFLSKDRINHYYFGNDGTVEFDTNSSFLAHLNLKLAIPITSSMDTSLAGALKGRIETLTHYALGIGSESTTYTTYSADISSGDGFLILIDLVSQALSQASGMVEINSKLLINSVPTAHKSFEYRKPTGKVGALLNINMQGTDTNDVPYGASIDFSIVLTDNLGAEHEYPLLVNGKLSSRDYAERWRGGVNGGPIDELAFGALDVVSDIFTKGLLRPVVMFDPEKVKYEAVDTKPENAIHDEEGQPIMPIIEPVARLDMTKILKRAYLTGGGRRFTTSLQQAIQDRMAKTLGMVSSSENDQEGIGLSNLIVNIKNYEVASGRADFSIESGWHNGALPSVAPYKPIYLIRDDTIYIINVDAKLPDGFSPYQIPRNTHKVLQESVPFVPDRNSVLLTYQQSATETRDSLLERVITSDETEVSADGNESIRVVEEKIEKYFAESPTDVVTEYTRKIETTTKARIGGQMVTVSREIQTNQYFRDLKTGHTKTTEALILVGPDRSNRLVDILEETYTTNWVQNPVYPDTYIQLQTETLTKGLVYIDSVEETVTNPVTGIDESYFRRYPVLLAQESGRITTDSLADFEWITIEKTLENLKRVIGNQYDVTIKYVDYLNNTVKPPETQTRAGQSSTDNYEGRSKTILIRDKVSEGIIGVRIPQALNAYELPKEQALALAETELKRFLNPPRLQPINLVGVNFIIEQGTVIQAQKRSGYSANFMVTGLSIKGENLGTEGHRINMSLETVELLPE